MKLNLSNYIKWMPALLMAGVVFTACSDDDEQVAEGFTVDQERIELTENGGEVALNLRTNDVWTASADADWYTVQPANGVGSGTCVVRVDSTYTYTEREGVIIFRIGNGGYKEIQIPVHQGGYAPVIKFEALQEDTVHVPHYKPLDKSYVDIVATANVPYEINLVGDAAEWLSFEKNTPVTYIPESTIPRKQSVRIRFKTHIRSDEERRGFVEYRETGKKNGIVTKVEIIQGKAPRIVPSREGDSLAMLTCAQMLGMGTANWNTSRPITHWNNVKTRLITYEYVDTENNIRETRTEERVVGLNLSMIDTKETLPDQIRYLDQLETLVVMANANSYIRDIEIGDAVTNLKKLRSLSLFGYGVCKLPDMTPMESLEEINLGANNFHSLKDVIEPLKNLGPQLKYILLNGNRLVDGRANLSTIPMSGIDPATGRHIGLTGELPKELFTTFPNLEYLNISYNYLYGKIPELTAADFADGRIMPKLEYFSTNLNQFTGNLPQWMCEHPKRACWNPWILVFNQEGRDHSNKAAGFDNTKTYLMNMPECIYDDEAMEELLSLPGLSKDEMRWNTTINGHWSSYFRQFDIMEFVNREEW